MFRSIRWRIALPYVILIAVATLALTFYLSGQVRRVRMSDLQDQLLADARLLADDLAPMLGQPGTTGQSLNAQAHSWAGLLDARVTIIGADGTVLGDSAQDPALMENHLTRPEVQQALATGQGVSVRYSATLGYEMMYAAVAVYNPTGEHVTGFARVALSLQAIDAGVRRLRLGIALAGLGIVVVAGLLALAIAEYTARPIRRLTEDVERLAGENLGSSLVAVQKDEVGQLTAAFRQMSEQLRDRMSSLAEERGRLAAVLERMADGVVITDESGHVELLNSAAGRLLGTSQAGFHGIPFAQVVRQYQIIDLWRKSHDSGQEQEDTVEIGLRNLFVRAIVTPFQEGESRGFLVILQDLTRIRRLETVRRDFIANISHELRTPLAGLKALVDTLRGGALKEPHTAKKFLKRMDAEVDAMTQIVEELLELSRIESGQAPLRLSPASVADLVEPPVERLRSQAESAGVGLVVSLPPGLPQVLADLDQIHKVVTNLVDNAVKFTTAGGSVTVSAKPAEEEVVVSVKDTGAGISAEDLPRIFERFYKADRARSRGGTGLGLAIARHIVEGHGGRIWAESVEGEGSTFCFTLPASRA